MAETMERSLIGSLLQCDSCQLSGNEAWAQVHAAQAGHSVFTVIADR